MKKMSGALCFVLILCLLGGMLPFALAENGEAETAVTEEAAPAEEAVEETEAAEAPAEDAAKEPAAWTVLIYLCGTDLETGGGMATTNLSMIANTVPNDAVNVLIQTGGTKSWQAKDAVGIDIAADRLQRWSWDENGFTLVDEEELASMAKHTTLSDFIRWGAENYPAEKYMLNLWDHGGGSATGLIADELHDSAIMSLEGLSRALKNGGVHFDLLMTDTCLMASLETAQAVAPYADCLAASEEALPGLGSNYEEWLQCLYDEPECGPVRVGRNICDATQILYAEGDDDTSSKSLTFSLIDLSKIDKVADAFNAYMKEVVSLIPDPAAFGQYLNTVSTTDRFMATEMWDLYDLARRGMKGGISKEAAIAVENAVDDAVIYSIRQAYHPYCHGLSVYLRYSDDGRGKLDRLARCCSNPWQLAFLDAVNLKWDAPEWVTDITGEIPQLKNELYTVKFDAEVAEDQSRTTLNIYSGISSGGYIRYELQRYNEPDQDWYTLGESEDVRLMDMTDEKVSFAAEFTGKWPAIDGEFLSISSKEVLGKKVLLQAPITLFGGAFFNLRILAEYPEDLTYSAPDEAAQDAAPSEEAESEHEVSYELEGVWDGYDSSTGLVNRNTWSMADLIGLDFQICRSVYSEYWGDIGDMKFSEPIPFTLDLEVEDTVLPEGQYRLRYTIKDRLDRTYHTAFFYLTWDGSSAVFADPDAEAADAPEDAAPEAADAAGLYEQAAALLEAEDYDAAVPLLQEAAELGNAEAQNELGKCYGLGLGVVQDDEEAVRYFRMAADQGFAKSQFNLANQYLYGVGVEQDAEKAAEYLVLAADQGLPQAQGLLGYMYENGFGVEADPVKAVEYYQAAADRGDSDAQNNLGNCYYYGRGVEQDIEKGVQYYQLAAEQGNPAALNSLGCCYSDGIGVEQDYGKAMEYFRAAAEQGNADAIYNIGYSCYFGEGVEVDCEKALEYFRTAAEMGQPNAMFLIGVYYHEGKGAEQDLGKAAEWYQQALDAGYEPDEMDQELMKEIFGEDDPTSEA